MQRFVDQRMIGISIGPTGLSLHITCSGNTAANSLRAHALQGDRNFFPPSWRATANAQRHSSASD